VSVIVARVGPAPAAPDRIERDAPTAQPAAPVRPATTELPAASTFRNSRLRWAGIAVIAVAVVGVIAIGVAQFL
jgi:hypothetical protein